MCTSIFFLLNLLWSIAFKWALRQASSLGKRARMSSLGIFAASGLLKAFVGLHWGSGTMMGAWVGGCRGCCLASSASSRALRSKGDELLWLLPCLAGNGSGRSLELAVSNGPCSEVRDVVPLSAFSSEDPDWCSVPVSDRATICVSFRALQGRIVILTRARPRFAFVLPRHFPYLVTDF